MRKFNKLISCLTALVLTVSTNVIAVNASTTYQKGDVDGNGSVDLIDVVSMVQFLNGNVGANGSTAERLDLNRDYVINSYDKNLLSSIVMGEANRPTLISNNTANLPAQESRLYRKYTPNGMFQGDYPLEMVGDISQSSPRAIIGGIDNRVPENGLEGVINVQSTSGGNVGTAFVVDSHTVLTAAHVLCDDNDNDDVVIVRNDLRYVAFDEYNVSLDITITPKMYHIPQNYFFNTNESIYDYAVIR